MFYCPGLLHGLVNTTFVSRNRWFNILIQYIQKPIQFGLWYVFSH